MICNPAWLPVADRAQPPAVRATAQPYTAGRPTPPATGKRQKRLICNLLPVAAELGLMSARICNSGLPLKRICNSPAPQNSSAGNSVGYTPRRWDQFPYTSSHRRRLGHLRGTSRAQVIFKKVRPLQYPLPADKKHLTQGDQTHVASLCSRQTDVVESGVLQERKS